MVKFCPQCGSLYSHQINDDDGKLNYICPSCDYRELVVDQCILINEMDTNAQDYPLSANMIYDHTLVRTKQIKCPNSGCTYQPTSDKDNAEIIIFNYNPTMLKTAYMCTSCHIYWKN